MDVRVSAVGVTGQDGEGFDLRQGLLQRGVTIEGLLESRDLYTPTYMKPMMGAEKPEGGERELNRLDIKNRQPLPSKLEMAVMAQLERLLPTVDGVVIADQVQERNYGVITDSVRAKLAQLATAHHTKIFIVDSRLRIGEFEQVIIKPNLHEAQAALDLPAAQSGPMDSEERMKVARACGQGLFERNQKPVFITLGSQGILVVTEAGVEHVPGIPVTGELDIVGAGDSVMAGLASALAAGGTTKEAAIIGNMAASITIQQLGTTGTASRTQLRDRFHSHFSGSI
jgi:bifunctional ADP-heptose synthase (sugar kinase/adenylyltransferase)